MAASAETIIGLRDLHAPPLTATDMLADSLLAGSLGMVLALLVALLLRPLTRRIRSPREIAFAELSQCRGLPASERLLVQARVLRRFASELKPSAELIANLRRQLYQPGDGIDLDRLERQLSLLFRQLRP